MKEDEIKKRLTELGFLIEDNKNIIQNTSDSNSQSKLYKLQAQLNKKKNNSNGNF